MNKNKLTPWSGSFHLSDYPRTYSASITKKIFASVVCATLAIYSLFKMRHFGAADDPVILVGYCFALLALGVFLMASIFCTKLTLKADRIEYQKLFSKQFMRRNQIKSWRTVQNAKYLELNSLIPGAKAMRIDLEFTPDAVFDAWFSDLRDLNREELELAEEEIQQDTALGDTPEERLSKSARAKKVATSAQILVAAIFGWAYFYPRPYYPLILFFLLLPWMAITTAWISKGLYTVGNPGKNTARADLTLLFILPPILLAIRASRDLDNFYWTHAIMPGIVVGILMTLIVGLMSAWFAGSLRTALLYAVLCSVYGTNTIVLANTFCDRSVPIVYPRQILTKYQSSGARYTRHYFTVPPWGISNAATEVQVPVDFYRTKIGGDMICIRRYAGAFRMPWYATENCKPGEIPAPVASLSEITAPITAMASAPTVSQVSVGNVPSVPSGMKLACMTGPNSPIPDGVSNTCPVVSYDGIAYWPFAYIDNRVSIGLVGYNQTGRVSQQEIKGTRYIWTVIVDATAQTVAFEGQGGRNPNVSIPWRQLK